MYVRTLAAGLLGVGVGIMMGYVLGKERHAAVPEPAAPTPPAAQTAPAAPPDASQEALARENNALKAQLNALRAQLARGPKGTWAAGGGADAGAHALQAGMPGLLSAEQVKAMAKDAATLVGELRKALASGDSARAGYLRSILWQYVQADPEAGSREVLALLKTETSPELLEMMAEVLMENDGSRTLPEVKAAFLQMAMGGEDPIRRRLGLDYLARTDIRAADVQDLLARRAQADPDRDLRAMAYQILTSPTSGLDDDAREKTRAKILGMLKTEKEPMVRVEALLAMDLAHAGEPLARTVLDYLRTDPEDGVRAAAAESLANVHSIPRGQMLEELERTYGSERSEVVQRSVLSSMLRVGGAEAAPALERLSRTPGPLSKEVDAYLNLLRSGITDFDELEARKAQVLGEPETLHSR
ncbi:MAG: HEAT repeat domain-containing protein [Planctomycetes bacterium]|nr:HEAT repeat domain-containing protein [Planctomycetota bacterium]